MSGDQLQPDDMLTGDDVDDVLDEGMSPPERWIEPEPDDTQGERLADTQPEVWEQAEAERDAEVVDGDVGGEVGEARSGRLMAPPDGGTEGLIDQDGFAEDEGIDGAAASAEEAAVHVIDSDA